MSTPTLYEILEVSEDASPEELRASHRRLMRRLHPDMPTGDAQRAALVNDAWERLSDPADRASYDLTLRYERERGSSDTDEAGWGSPETDDAEAWDEPWDDGWGTVSGDEDDAPQDLFEEAAPDEPADEPWPEDEDPSAREDAGGSWADPFEDLDDDWFEAETAHQGVDTTAGAGEPTPERSLEDPRRRAGLDAWAQIPGGRHAMSWWTQAEALRQSPESAPGAAGRAGQLLAHTLLGSESQKLLLFIVPLFVVYPGALAAMSIWVLEDSVGVIAAFFVWVLTIGFVMAPAMIASRRRAIVLAVLPLVVPVPGLVMPVQGLIAAIHRLADPSLPRSTEIPLLVLAVYASCLLVSGCLLLTFRMKDSPAVLPPWTSHLVPVDRFTLHRQWGDPARLLGRHQHGKETALTSQLLDEVASIPGIRIVHNLRPDPGSSMLIDHAVLSGRTLLIVESICLPGGTWVRSPDGLRPEHAPADPPIPFEARRAAQRMKRRFLRMEVEPVVVVHTDDGRPVRIVAQDSDQRPLVLSAPDFAEVVGLLCVQHRGRRARRRPFSELVHLMS